MKELYSPRNEVELALIKSILDAEFINYFVRNDYFGSMRIGPEIELLNKKLVLVQDDRYGRAKELLEGYLMEKKEPLVGEDPGYSLFDKVRMVFEYLLFGWFIPGRKRKH